MPALLRKLQKIFGGSLTPASNLAILGSTAAGAAVYSNDPDDIQSLTRYLQGFTQQTVGNSSPVLEEQNALNFLLTRQLSYLFQRGIPEWLSTETYWIGSFCSVAGVVFISKTDNNVGNAVTDTNNWATLASSVAPSYDARALAKGWISFNGQAGLAVNSSFGIAGVTRLGGVGNYLLTFPALAAADYSFALSCTQENSVAATIMATRFPADIKTATTLQVRTVSNFDSSGFDAPEVNVQIFASG